MPTPDSGLHRESCDIALCRDPEFKTFVRCTALFDSGANLDCVSPATLQKLLKFYEGTPVVEVANSTLRFTQRPDGTCKDSTRVRRGIQFGRSSYSGSYQVIPVLIRMVLQGVPLLMQLELTEFNVNDEEIVFSKQTLIKYGLLSYMDDPLK